MIFDTNVIIFISKNIIKVENLISPNIKPSISIITYIEALGYKFETTEDLLYMQQICSSCQLVNISDLIVLETINLRKKHRIKLPDAIIYATAIVENVPLLTNNTKDFIALDGGVKLINPLDL